jgi:hypothetical protein
MPCSCQKSPAHTSHETLSDEQLQYVVDLTNRRNDAAVCKTGKLCNGRCIPKNHKCGSKLGSSQSGESSGRGRSILKGAATAGLVGAGVVGAGAAANAISGGRIGHAVTNAGLNVAEAGIDKTNRFVQNKVAATGEKIANTSKRATSALEETTKQYKSAAEKMKADPKASESEKAALQQTAESVESGSEMIRGQINKTGANAFKKVSQVGVTSGKATKKGKAYINALREKSAAKMAARSQKASS